MLFALLLGACNDAGFALVSISPIYGWSDGCGAITLSGHGFGSAVSASIGGTDVVELTTPEAADLRGFQVSGTVPAGEAGYADVSLTSDGVTSTLTGTGGYYYVSCPAPGHVDAVSPADGLVGGELVVVEGCGLDTATMAVNLVDGTGVVQGGDLPLVGLCGTATASFEAPVLPAGSFHVEVIDLATRAVLSGGPCTSPDTALDTGGGCEAVTLTYGGAP